MLLKPIQMAHQMVSQVVAEGDIVVDATLGNGHDALFLTKLVGRSGKVIGFDIQDAAVNSSTELFRNKGIDSNNYQFHQLGHECMAEVMKDEVSAVMFNLGYLPNADKSVITQSGTTLIALKASLQLLRGGGILSIMCYSGHAGGDVESTEVVAWASDLERNSYRVFKYGMLNAPNNPPFLVVVEKV